MAKLIKPGISVSTRGKLINPRKKSDIQWNPQYAKSMSHKIKRVIETDATVKADLEQIVSDKRKEVVYLARSYFEAAIVGVIDLINNSEVDVKGRILPKGAHADPENTFEETIRKRVTLNREGEPYKPKQIYAPAPKFFLGVPISSGVFSAPEADKSANQKDIEFKVRWPKMTYAYAKRRPTSQRFYFKRTELDKNTEVRGSSRLAFAANFQSPSVLAKRIHATAAYQKGKVTYKPEGGKLYSISFSINYPPLGPRYDALRLAFLHGAKTTGDLNAEAQVKLKGYDPRDDGIAFAENYRPMLRLFTGRMGRLFREHLRRSRKNL